MKRIISLSFIAILLFPSCKSYTLIQTGVTGASGETNATVYIDGVNAGSAPVTMSNKKVVTSCTDIRIEKEGYETISTEICRDEEIDIGPAIGGFFVGIPWLWCLKYSPSHYYELQPLKAVTPNNNTQSTEQKLLELKQLFEKQLITEEEYKKSKEKILNNQ